MLTQKQPPTIDVNEFIVQLEQLERLAKILPISTGAASLGSLGGAVGAASGILTLTPFIVASGIGTGGVIALTHYLKHRRETLLSVLETLQSLHKVSEEEYLSFRQRLLLILVEGPGKPKEISKLESARNYQQKYKRESQIEQSVINLSQWFHYKIDSSWQMVEEILGKEKTQSLFAVRSKSNGEILRAKKINLTTNINLCLIVGIISRDNAIDKKISITLQIHPTEEAIYLPLGLQFNIVDSSGKPLQTKTLNRQEEWMKQEIIGELGEKFRIEFKLGDSIVSTKFVI